MERVVPLAMKRMRGQLQLGHLRVGDFDRLGIVAVINLGPNAEARVRRGLADKRDDGRQIDEGLAAPVHRDVRKQSMLYLIPLAGARRKMTDGDRESGAVGELLQFPFP